MAGVPLAGTDWIRAAAERGTARSRAARLQRSETRISCLAILGR